MAVEYCGLWGACKVIASIAYLWQLIYAIQSNTNAIEYNALQGNTDLSIIAVP